MAKKPRADGNPNIVKLWPTTILVKRFAHFQKVNPALLERFSSNATARLRYLSTGIMNSASSPLSDQRAVTVLTLV